jgi:4-aminobutyrate aminotransferase/(S)-3-amino-2-methylpropionate transaminase
MTDTLAPTVEAVPTARQVVTAIPGPKSTELHARRTAVVSAGVSSALPVYIERDGLLAVAKRIEGVLKPGLLDLQKRYPVIAEVRGIGAMIAIEFADPATHEPRADIPGAIAAYAAQQGVLVLTAGTYGNVIRFLPSLAITEEQLRDALGVIADALATV